MTQSEARRDGERKLFNILFCAVSSVLILAVCSMNSPLYPFNGHVDVNIFVTVARGIQRGLMPYRDLIDQKGPLLFCLHALFLPLAPGYFNGIFLWECISFTVILYFFHRIARLYVPDINIGWMAVLGALICVSAAYSGGDMAEEQCMPFMLPSIYAALLELRGERRLKYREFLLHGALAGCVAMIKINLLGVHFCFMAFLAIRTLAVDKRLAPAVGRCAVFLLGMLAAALPLLAWLWLNGALDAFIRMYFIDNVVRYGDHGASIPIRIYEGLRIAFHLDHWFGVLTILNAVLMLITPIKRMPVADKLFWLAMMAVTGCFVYMGGNAMLYYLLAFGPFFVLLTLPLGWISRRPLKFGNRRLVTCGLAACAAAVCLVRCTLIPCLGANLEECAQGRVAEIINRSEDKSILGFGLMDSGFYYLTDTLPVNRYFSLLNVNQEECRAEQEEVLRQGKAKFVITRFKPLEMITDVPNDYVLVENVKPTGRLPIEFEFFLYERRDSEASTVPEKAPVSADD